MTRSNAFLLGSMFVLLAGCGSGGRGFGDGGPGDDGGSPCDPNDPFCDPNVQEGGEGSAPCENLKCQQVTCGGGGTTTVSGTVWDPAGKNPLYNVVVYVPNAPVDKIPHGPVCDSCGGANISGKPVVTTLTDTAGKFVLKDVPVGTNIPLVIQVGKWRKQIVLPNVAQCTDNPITDKNKTRLPAKKSEGDMPLIALTGGCDPIHVLVQKIGVDLSELTPASGSGMVHVYSGMGNQNGGVAGATDAYAFWGNLNAMMKYDIIINECECSPYKRDTNGPAYTNIRKFLDAGGRVFHSHYHLNFFANDNQGTTTNADPELSGAATWSLWGGSSGSSPYLIDTSFPKGKAMDDWLWNLKTLSGWGATIKTTPKGQIQTFSVGDIGGTKMGISQRWIYASTGSSIAYVSFNTPTNLTADKRCGRAVGTDMHVGNGQLNMMSEQEAALEFMFFDLAACVIDDGKVPEPPPPN